MKIPLHVAPDAMDVVGYVPSGIRLDIDELDEEAWSLHDVVVSNAWIRRPGPCEMDLCRNLLFR